MIERMQNFVCDEIKRTLDEYPECLDAPGNKISRSAYSQCILYT